MSHGSPRVRLRVFYHYGNLWQSDSGVSVGDQDMVDTLKAAGSNVKFTIYPDAGHDSWTASYKDPEFWKWLFDQRKK